MKKRGDIPSLTGARFFAALFVLMGHTDGYFATLQPAWLEYGWRVCTELGMVTFFTLSGFVIHYNCGAAIAATGPPAIFSFLVARFARLYPLYLFAFMIGAAVNTDTLTSDVFARVWLRYATLTQDWTPTLIDGRLLTNLYVGSAWSISLEVGLYLFYIPSILALNMLRTPQRTVYAIAGLTFASLIVFGGYVSGFWLRNLDPPQWWMSASPWCRIPEFMLGALCAQLFLQVDALPRTRSEKAKAVWLGAAGLVWIAGAFLLSYKFIYINDAFCFAPGVAAFIFSLARYSGAAAIIFENRAVVALGDASYSIYLLHGLLLGLIMQGPTPSIPMAVFRIAVAWSLVAFLSLGVYRYLEAPSRKFIRRLVPRRWSSPAISRLVAVAPVAADIR